jgi:DNA-binding transcriptional ArsR family regulator
MYAAMGSLVSLFGKSPRVAILEAFAEDPDLEFSAPEIARETEVSRRGVYMHLRKLLREGVIVPSRKVGKGWYYRLNENDRRAKILPFLDSVVTLGRIESAIKADEGIPADAPLPRDAPRAPGFFLPAVPGTAANELAEQPPEFRFPFAVGLAPTAPRIKMHPALDEATERPLVAT